VNVRAARSDRDADRLERRIARVVPDDEFLGVAAVVHVGVVEIDGSSAADEHVAKPLSIAVHGSIGRLVDEVDDECFGLR
jgi:hypothetical protein